MDKNVSDRAISFIKRLLNSGIDQKKLGKNLNISQQSISAYLNGGNISMKTVLKLIQLYPEARTFIYESSHFL